jgi:hypothetical protein
MALCNKENSSGTVYVDRTWAVENVKFIAYCNKILPDPDRVIIQLNLFLPESILS